MNITDLSNNLFCRISIKSLSIITGYSMATHKVSVVYEDRTNLTNSPLHQLTIVIHHSGLHLAAVHREADNLHLHEGIDDLTERRYKALKVQLRTNHLLYKSFKTFQQSHSVTSWFGSFFKFHKFKLQAWLKITITTQWRDEVCNTPKCCFPQDNLLKVYYTDLSLHSYNTHEIDAAEPEILALLFLPFLSKPGGTTLPTIQLDRSKSEIRVCIMLVGANGAWNLWPQAKVHFHTIRLDTGHSGDTKGFTQLLCERFPFTCKFPCFSVCLKF